MGHGANKVSGAVSPGAEWGFEANGDTGLPPISPALVALQHATC